MRFGTGRFRKCQRSSLKIGGTDVQSRRKTRLSFPDDRKNNQISNHRFCKRSIRKRKTFILLKIQRKHFGDYLRYLFVWNNETIKYTIPGWLFRWVLLYSVLFCSQARPKYKSTLVLIPRNKIMKRLVRQFPTFVLFTAEVIHVKKTINFCNYRCCTNCQQVELSKKKGHAVSILYLYWANIKQLI